MAGRFELQPPFVPGRRVAQASAPSGFAPAQPVAEVYPPIEDYLEENATATSPGGWDATPDEEYGAPGDERWDDPSEAPPIEHFMDSEQDLDAAGSSIPSFMPPSTGDDAVWGETDWQGYDWRSAGALGEGAEEASDDWAATDWQGGANPPPRDTRQSAAQAIAAALDQIAERIRSGELSVPAAGLVTDQATIAATLAALLGVRR